MPTTDSIYSNREEITSLEDKVSQARERYQQTVIAAKNDTSALSALPQFPIHDKFVLNQDEAWYTLSIEIQLPIDTVMLQVHAHEMYSSSNYYFNIKAMSLCEKSPYKHILEFIFVQNILGDEEFSNALRVLLDLHLPMVCVGWEVIILMVCMLTLSFFLILLE